MERRWFVLAILTASYGAGAFGMLGISPLSPSLVAGFGLSRLQVALIVPSIYLAGLMFSLPGGRLADRLGARPSLLGGLAIGAAGLAIGALSPGFSVFLLCLFEAGIGWSAVNPALGKAIMDIFPPRRAQHRDGHQADGPHARRDRLGAGAAAGRGGLAWRAAILSFAGTPTRGRGPRSRRCPRWPPPQGSSSARRSSASAARKSKGASTAPSEPQAALFPRIGTFFSAAAVVGSA